jgi:hydroxymethylbilane synthase
VCDALQAAGQRTELVQIMTTGDIDRVTPLARFGMPAVFSRELDEALLDHRIDFAVHSLKDLPTNLPEGIALAGVSAREDARDALVSRGGLRWADIPRGATIATSSLRRQAQLHRARPDLQIVDLRGNIGTRIDRLDATREWSAIILATAGLVRLGLEGRISERLPLELMLPAPGQAALAVTVRSDDHDVAAAVKAAVEDSVAARATAAERALLRFLEGGCHVPVAAYAEFAGPEPEVLRVRARVTSLDGRQITEGTHRGLARSIADAETLGAELAERLIADGASHLLEVARRQAESRLG